MVFGLPISLLNLLIFLDKKLHLLRFLILIFGVHLFQALQLVAQDFDLILIPINTILQLSPFSFKLSILLLRDLIATFKNCFIPISLQLI